MAAADAIVIFWTYSVTLKYEPMFYFTQKENSHIRHLRAGRALLRWRKECGRLWVQLASAVQAPIHSVTYMYTDSY